MNAHQIEVDQIRDSKGRLGKDKNPHRYRILQQANTTHHGIL